MEAETHDEYVAPHNLQYFVMRRMLVDEETAKQVLRQVGVTYLSLFEEEDCYRA